MKKTILTIAVVSALTLSCKKDEPCNCGIIQSDNAQNYSVVIKNECSDNNKEFVLSQGDWMNAYVGSRYCITNSGKW
jgi:hypothetical protein